MKTEHRIKLLVMDVDGTLTDGKIYMGPHGEIMKAFNCKDGYAIHEKLPRAGIEPIIITGRSSAIVEKRCAELGIKRLYQGVENKCQTLENICTELGFELSNVCYIGDDDNDYECIKAVAAAGGIGACPSDASECIKQSSTIILRCSGGTGAVRELIDNLLTRW